jgi:chromosome segregation ATPase
MMILALVLVFIGCAKPPEAEKAAAKTAMDAAVAAGAEKYATADFDAAKSQWGAAEAKMNEKKYDEAKQGYVSVKAAFEKAAAAAATGKKAMTDEVIAAVTALEASWKTLDESAKDVEKKMQDKKEAWEADAKAFGDGIKAAKDKIAADPAGVKAKVGELKAIIDKWDAAFKELAAAPEPAKKKGKK